MSQPTMARRYLLVALIITSYAIFALPHITFNRFSTAPNDLYHYLTAGFLAGKLNLAIDPSPELLNMVNPYDPNEDATIRLHFHDASLYNNKYYLYFGPLPVVTFYMPFKLITGLYPPAALAIFFYISIGFILNFLLLSKIKDKYFPMLSELQLYFAGVLIGLTSNSSFLLFNPRQIFIFIGIMSTLIGINFGMMSYGFRWGFSLFSAMTIVLFYLIPCTIALTYLTMRSIQPVKQE